MRVTSSEIRRGMLGNFSTQNPMISLLALELLGERCSEQREFFCDEPHEGVKYVSSKFFVLLLSIIFSWLALFLSEKV